MKATELRIGNYAQNIFGIIRIEEIPLKSNPLYNPEAIDPIPLTEEWFTKFSFRTSNNLFEHPEPSNPELEHADIGLCYPSFFFNKRLNRWMDCHTRVCIDYVHQLQNLYFSLTGEELVLK